MKIHVTIQFEAQTEDYHACPSTVDGGRALVNSMIAGTADFPPMWNMKVTVVDAKELAKARRALLKVNRRKGGKKS